MAYRASVYIDAVIRVGERECVIRRYRHKKRFADLKNAKQFIAEFPNIGMDTGGSNAEFGCTFRIGGTEIVIIDDAGGCGIDE